MNAVVKHETMDIQSPSASQAPAPASDSGSLLAVIGRMAENPQVDVTKLERLMALYERTQAANAKSTYMIALAAMQPELPTITERGEIKHGDKVLSRYAKWPDINEAIKPVLAKHAFTLTHRVTQRDNKVCITGILSHGGHSEETTIELPIDATGAKNGVQAIGSSTSYGQRYTGKLLLNISSRAPEDKDDDGEAASVGDLITDEQAQQVSLLLTETKSNLPIFLKHFGVAGVPEIKAKQLPKVLAKLQAKRATMAKEASNG